MIQSATIAKIRLWAEQFSAGAPPPPSKVAKGKTLALADQNGLKLGNYV